MKYIFSFGAVLMLALFMAGCDNSNDPAPMPPPPGVEAVYLEPTAVTLDVGTSEKFQALAVVDGLTTDVTDQASWSLVNNNNTVELDATDPSLVLAIAVGGDSVTASFGGVTSDPATVTVIEEQLVSIAVAPADVTMVVSTTQAFSAEGTYNTGRKQDLTDESKWESNNGVFVTMEGNIATAVQAAPVSNITASFEGVTSPAATVATFDVIQRLEMIPDVTELFNGQSQLYRAYAYFAGSPTEPQDITGDANWSSSDTAVLVPDGPRGVYKGIGAGTSTITASHTNAVNDKVEITKTITVLAVFLDRIEIRPAISTVVVGNTREYDVWGINTDLSEYKLYLRSNLKMTVSDPTKAYLKQNVNSNTYVLMATKEGDVTLTAEYLEPANPSRPAEEHHDTALVTIRP